MKITTVFASITFFFGGGYVVASAQQSPLRECKQENPRMQGMKLNCTITENDTAIKDIILNRGACQSAKEFEDLVMGTPSPVGYPPTVRWLGKSYKFGERASIPLYFQCNIIEATVVTNKGSWIFTW